jgi:hypothetical protein
VIYFGNIDNPRTRRAYKSNAVSGSPVNGVKRPKMASIEGNTPAMGDHKARSLLLAP